MMNQNNFHPEVHLFQGPKIVRVLFDETHSESWTTDLDHAKMINPEDPSYSCYSLAAQSLSSRGFEIKRNTDHPLESPTLNSTDLLVLLHPCDPIWEKTVSDTSPLLSTKEIHSIHEFVENGGSLLIITEYEHEKYGDNLNSLLRRWNIQIESNTVLDRAHCNHENHAWIFSEPTAQGKALSHGVTQACFYQAGACRVTPPAQILRQSHTSSYPSQAGLIAAASPGKGRVMVITDSRLFGDEYFHQHGHRNLWLNIIYHLSLPAFQRYHDRKEALVGLPPEWIQLKNEVDALRVIQNPDGSIDESHHPLAHEKVRNILALQDNLQILFPHQKEYWSHVRLDFQAWIDQKFSKPDFRRSLESFYPHQNRVPEMKHLALFPLYTPNGSRDIRFEAILFKTPWPTWIEALERDRFTNPKFVPGALLDYTQGYKSDCAVLFPETVSISGKPINSFGTIFCDREAHRLLHYSREAVTHLQVNLSPFAETFLASPLLAQQTIELWDLIHDQAHSLGELPFDPFMIRQRSPYWMYSLEELRVDLRAFGEAHRLSQSEFPFAEYVPLAILFDRIFRFPIVGNRIRNYDGLGGQILFSALHHKNILKWCDNRLEVDWIQLPQGIQELLDEITELYRNAAESSKISFWLDAHDLVSRYVRPNVASQWKKEARAVNNETDTSQWLSMILDDEFPLGQFHLNLQKKISPHNSHQAEAR